MTDGTIANAAEQKRLNGWIVGLGQTNKTQVKVFSCRQGWARLGLGRSVCQSPIRLLEKEYALGLGTHADSEIVLRSTSPLKTFRAWVGVDHHKTFPSEGVLLVFSVWVEGKILAESQPLEVSSPPERLEVSLNGTTEFTLKVKTLNTLNNAFADWAEAEVVTVQGETVKVGTQENAFVSSTLPISFHYNGSNSEDWFNRWGINHTERDGDDFITHCYVCADKDTGLECTFEMQAYKKFPACLWNVHFKNNSKSITPILENVNTLDLFWPAQNRKTLYRARGAFRYEDEAFNAEAFRDDFMLIEDDLAHSPEVSMNAVNGRSSMNWMPYYNYAGEDSGLIFGIGWTGNWQTQINAETDFVHFQAGMKKIHTVLKPGESIRQPSILMIHWQGDEPIRGHNLLRRFMTEEILPHYDGGPVQTPVTYGSWGRMTAEEHLKRIANIKEQNLPYDYYWIDADWYGPDMEAGGDTQDTNWSVNVGNWRINPIIYPKGLRPISDAAHDAGMKFLLWFEPERAVYGTPITQEHPDWFLGEKKEGRSLLLNLGNPAAREWCVEFVSEMIRTQGIDCYRQDFNFGELPYWLDHDTSDQTGMTEIRHVEGLYEFLDELRRRFPKLLIDNCAGGGCRLDFEMMRRSIPLWASDMQCFPDYVTERNQQFVHGLSLWLPQFSMGTEGKHHGDTYHFRSTMAAGICAHLFPSMLVPIDPKYPYQWLRDRLEEYHRAKVYFSGDFYPLMPLNHSFRDWSVFQFDRPDLGSGLLEVFRKSGSPIEKVCLQLRGLDSSAMYEIEDVDSKQAVQVTGQNLMEEGWPVEIMNHRDSRLFFYHLINVVK